MIIKKNRFGTFIPLITFFIIFTISNIFNLKGLFIVGIVVLFPLSFMIEGIICARKNIGWIAPLALSLITFLVIIFVYLNDSANIYLIYYSIAYILGYIPTKLVLKLKYSKTK
ncbi:hypothetical protein [Faecalimicrobium dakarense]|uniref:hypothetical protein n=1 Tax=Faecalimicrobium dakarense TaxID=1301100 RepID=UPI0004B6E811|nr:hypothetical protein [[Clostridium] dakarense]